MNDLSHGLLISAVGMGIVFGVLATISLMVYCIRRVDDRWQADEVESAQERLAAEPTIDTTTIVLISAAVATLLGGRGRIRRIHRRLPGDSPGSPWSTQGRMSVQGSHLITRKGGRRP